jgi:hypothetical protein
MSKRDPLLAEVLAGQNRLNRLGRLAAKLHSHNPFRALALMDAALRSPTAGGVPVRTAARPRGAGRPAGRTATRSSVRSGDSGDDDPGAAEPYPRQRVRLVREVRAM